MSSMHVLFLVIYLVHYSYSTIDLYFQVQPQLIRINNQDEQYVTNDDHYIGQVLFQNDRLQLACECQTSLNRLSSNIYWTVNNKIINQYNNSNNFELIINRGTVQVPITYVTCHCVFFQPNSKIKRDYQYLLYIDLESEPSLEPIQYSRPSGMIKQHFSDFIHRHSLVILSFLLIIIGITCPLLILSFILPYYRNYLY